jgi:uncharacterized membrane protein
MEYVGLCYGRLVYFTAIWYIIPILVCCKKKNLATLKQKFKFSSREFPVLPEGSLFILMSQNLNFFH